ncbi:hypothetical protein L2E82_52919 [Cichorium intybus]|nr:hypothetical protein L2E82_52919 [Cichorium intybus]
MLTLEPFSEDQGRSAVHPARGIPPISFLAPCGFTHPLTRTHVRLLGPCSRRAEWGAHRPVPGARRYIAETARAANHDRRDGISTSLSTARALAAAPIRTGPRPESIGGPAIAVPHPTGTHRRPPSLPSRQFQALFDSLFKVLFIFPSRYLFAIGLTPVFSLGRNLPPYWGLHSQTTRLADSASWCDRVRARRGSHPLWRPLPGDLGPVPPLRTLLQTTIRTARPPDFQAGLIPRVVPPDLGSRSKHRLKTTHWGLHQGASLTAHDARHNTRVFSTTTSRASTEGDSSLGQPHHKHGRPISAPMPCVPIRGAWLGRRDA